MKISGVQKSTTIDYPWKLACIVFTLWCNFRCPFCHNPETVLPEQMQLISNDLIPEEAIFNFLQARVGKLDWVSICGWEPTLQPDLYDFAKRVKEMWFAVKVDTNGRDVAIIKKMVKDWILDYVAVDLKHTKPQYDTAVWIQPSSEFFESYEELKDFLLSEVVDYEYRTTIVKWMHTIQDVEAMAEYIKGARHYYLQNYVWWNTLKPDFWWQAFDDDELEAMSRVISKYVLHSGIRR